MMLPSRPLRLLSRRVPSAGVLVFSCLLCCGCESPKVSSENLKRVKKGMTIQQAERILGPGADGRYPAVDRQWDEDWLKSQGIPANAVWKHWPDPAQTESQKDIAYNIAFANDRVVGVVVHSVQK